MEDRQLSALLEQVRRGDRDAFEEMYRDMSAPIFTVLMRITRDRGLAEDTLQEFFLKMYRTPPPASVKKPRAYLFRTAENMALDALRARRQAESADGSARPAQGGDPLRRLVVEEAFEALPPAQRRVITLHLNGGLKFREIAAVTGEPLGTVLWRYRKGIDKLRELLSGGIL